MQKLSESLWVCARWEREKESTLSIFSAAAKYYIPKVDCLSQKKKKGENKYKQRERGEM